MNWMDGIPLWDHHCHAILRETERTNWEAWARALTEAPIDYPLTDIKNTVVFQSSLAVASDVLGTSPHVEELEKAFWATDYQQYCRTLFTQSGYGRLYIDTGFTPTSSWSVTEMGEILGIPTFPILRLETTAEHLLTTTHNFDAWVEAFESEISQARENGYLGAKSIIAYRSGLHVRPASVDSARIAYESLRKSGQVRLTDPDLLNFMLYFATPILIGQHLPLQFHTGYGDPDTDLLMGNPLHLRGYLEKFSPQGHVVALLHTYPYQREAGYLASVYPGVYVDVSLAIPLATFGATGILHELLELAPVSRVLFASDSHSRPESYFLAAKFFRQGVNQFLTEVVRRHHVLPEQAETWAQLVSFQNAQRIYEV